MITRVYERRRLVECLFEGLIGLFSLDDVTLVVNSHAVKDEQQNFLIFNQPQPTEVSRTPQKTQRNDHLNVERRSELTPRSKELRANSRLNEYVHQEPHSDERNHSFIIAERAKKPVTMLKRELRGDSSPNSNFSYANESVRSYSNTTGETRFYNYS